jgi:hypothetical protein
MNRMWESNPHKHLFFIKNKPLTYWRNPIYFLKLLLFPPPLGLGFHIPLFHKYMKFHQRL